MLLPSLSELLAQMHVVTLDLQKEFRGVTSRELVLFEGPSGWGEFAPFLNHDDQHSARWLQGAIEAAFGQWPVARRESFEVNAIVPLIPADQIDLYVEELFLKSGFRTYKIKCGSEKFADDLDRVSQLRTTLDRLVGTDAKIRIDINGLWSVTDAVERINQLDTAARGLEYVEQPVASLEDCSAIRKAVDVPIAIDEGIRLLADTDANLKNIQLAGDIAILKAIPLGGVKRCLELADDLKMPVVVSGSMDSSIGLASGAALAAALPELTFASGLGTGLLLKNDVVREVQIPLEGRMSAFRCEPDFAELESATRRTDVERVTYWEQRLTRCYKVLEKW